MLKVMAAMGAERRHRKESRVWAAPVLAVAVSDFPVIVPEPVAVVVVDIATVVPVVVVEMEGEEEGDMLMLIERKHVSVYYLMGRG
jgi:hypothetical protein